MIDRVLGNSYRIVEKIGEGGMGSVYRAIDLMLEREVAIKAIRPELAREKEIVDRFRSEARTLARVSHPAIATIYSFFEDGGDLFLAMEYVRGRSLSKVLEGSGPLPWDQAIRLLSSALEGIEQAHRAGIIHRDIKPDNLMITETGTIKVMDFGIARVAGSTHLTRTGLLVGTLRYMAPEQIQGEEADHRADIYALGAVLYQMLTGRPPFEGKSDFAILRAQIEELPPPPSAIVPEIPGWLDQAVLRALAKRPTERFQSVEEMHRFLATRGGTAMPSEPTRVTGIRPEGIAELPTIVTPPRAVPSVAAVPPPLPPSIPTARSAAAPAVDQSSYRPIPADAPAGGTAWKVAVGVAAVLALLTGVGLALWMRNERPPETAQGPASTAVPAEEIGSAVSPPVTPTPAPAAKATPAPANVETPRGASPPPSPKSATPHGASLQEPTPAVMETPAITTPVETPAEPSLETVEEVPAAPIDELKRLGGELRSESARLIETYDAFLNKKDEEDAEITDADEELQELIESFAGTAEKLDSQLSGGGFFARLRNRKDKDARPQLAKRFRALADRGAQVERLMAQVQPGPEVTQAWQGIRRRWQRVGAIIAGLQ